MYDAVNSGVVRVDRLRRALAGPPLPRDAQGRLMLAVDVGAWLRPDAPTAADRSFCHLYGRGRNASQRIPGWLYSFVVGFGACAVGLDRGVGRGTATAHR